MTEKHNPIDALEEIRQQLAEEIARLTAERDEARNLVRSMAFDAEAAFTGTQQLGYTGPYCPNVRRAGGGRYAGRLALYPGCYRSLGC